MCFIPNKRRKVCVYWLSSRYTHPSEGCTPPHHTHYTLKLLGSTYARSPSPPLRTAGGLSRVRLALLVVVVVGSLTCVGRTRAVSRLAIHMRGRRAPPAHGRSTRLCSVIAGDASLCAGRTYALPWIQHTDLGQKIEMEEGGSN